MKYKHLIWDFDGTLYDTYGEIAHVMLRVLEEKGIKEDYEFVSKYMHMSLRHTFDALSQKHNLDYDELRADFKKAEESMDAYSVAPFEAVEIIMNAPGVLNYIATNRGLSIFPFLDVRDYTKRFVDIVHADMDITLKPASDMADYIIEKYSLDKSEVLFIGDRDVDLDCANGAGIDSCYFDSHNRANKSSCTYYVKSFYELADKLKIPYQKD